MERILNRGWESFPMEIDKFARIFMVAGSKSLISFTELEKEFYNWFQDLKDDSEFVQVKWNTLYKYISYSLIIHGIDL